jgi:MerR family transcriptional regulator, mercuric resistance operon regulatory protein
MTNARTYTTSQLADAAAVGSQTLRYYERRGLLPEPPRTRGGHRLYGPKHLARLQFIQKIQCLGFPLEDIHDLLRVEEGPGKPSETARTLEHFIGRIDEKASALTEMRASLAALRLQAEAGLNGAVETG